MVVTCRHCGNSRKMKCRGLCNPCYDDLNVRDLYPRNDHRSATECGVGANDVDRPLPIPTDAPPGSAAKIRVLAARAAAEQLLWHPDDCGSGR